MGSALAWKHFQHVFLTFGITLAWWFFRRLTARLWPIFDRFSSHSLLMLAKVLDNQGWSF